MMQAKSALVVRMTRTAAGRSPKSNRLGAVQQTDWRYGGKPCSSFG
jgi:hypothetical protein